ncbi:MAG: NADH-ubiquinone dehydrogenase [Pseudorhodoplanes sp.]
MSIFPGPDELLPGTKALEQMSKDFAALMPKEFAGSVNLMAHPAAGVAAFSALGFGMASHALGVWIGTAAGTAEASRRWFMPFLEEVTADDFRDTRRTPAKRARAVTETLIADARSVAAEVTDAAAKPVDVQAKDAQPSAVIEEASPRSDDAASATPAIASVPEVSQDSVSHSVEADAVSSSDVTAPLPSADLMPEDFRRPKPVDRPEAPNDLKLISGIGPKLEKVLNGLGIWTYTQIAGWSREEVAWVDDYLSFKGRIERDDWLEQAAKLADGATKH